MSAHSKAIAALEERKGLVESTRDRAQGRVNEAYADAGRYQQIVNETREEIAALDRAIDALRDVF